MGVSHTLLVAPTDRVRQAGAAAWVDHELATGAKVHYKGWAADHPDGHWLTGRDGSPRARAALESGQLEFLAFPTVVELAGGTAVGLRHLLTDEVERALDDGWGRIAMTQESFHRPMVDGAEFAEFVAQEACFDRLAERRPLQVLCQLTLDEENDAAVDAAAAVHHHDLVDLGWSARTASGRWRPAGDLDVVVAHRVAAALRGALARPTPPDDEALHVDLGEVAFLDVAVVHVLGEVAAESRPPGAARRVVLHRAGPLVRRLLAALDPGPSLVLAEVGA